MKNNKKYSSYNELKEKIDELNKKIPIGFNPNSGFEVISNNSFIKNGVAYLNLRIKCNPKISSREEIGLFTNLTSSVFYRIQTICASIFTSYMDKVSNGYITPSGELFIGDNLDESVEEINITSTLLII